MSKIKSLGSARVSQYVLGDFGATPSSNILGIPLTKINIQDLRFQDDTFDLIICNHVLEHVPDDMKALREFYRVMKPGGIGMITAPFYMQYVKTDEDPSITDPQVRERRFFQTDHVRRYGADFIDRPIKAGFQVQVTGMSSWFRQQRQWQVWSQFANPEFLEGFAGKDTTLFKPA